MKKLQADTGKMQLNVGNYPMLGGLLGGLGGKALGLGGAASAGMALASVVKNNVELARDYEKALSVLAAILGTTKEGIKELDAQAQQLGATTTFTASEVAELQTELAKLGYSVKEITNMAPAILNFSQATGASLADAASLAGAALRMFEKDSEDTTEFVDKMSAATTKSALNFSYLQNAMSTVAPVANAFGFQLEDVLALLGQLANAGFDASSAATATRNILLNLADANGKLAQALGEPVTTLDDLINGLQELNDRGIDLGESLELTDKRSVAAFNTFLSGVDKVRQLRDELQKCDGWAAKMGETMNNNLAGSLKQLESAWEGFNLHINQSNGLLRKMVDWLTLAVNNLDKMLKRLEAYYQIAKTFKNKLFGGGSSAETPFVSPEDYPTFDIFKPNEPSGNKPQGNKPTGGTPTGGNTLRTQEQQQKEMLDLRRKYEDAMTELIEDEDSRQYVQMQNKYNREIADLQATLEKKKAAKQLSLEDEKLYNQQIAALTEVRDKKLNDLVDKQNDKLKQDREKKKREDEQAKQQSIRMQERAIQLQYETEMEGIEQLETSEKEKTRMRLEAEKNRLNALLALYQADGKKLADEEIKLIKKQIEGVDQELEKNKKRDNDLYDVLGFKLTDEKKEAIDTALNYSLEAVNQWVSSLSAAADKERELADAQVDRAQNVLEKEIEARNNGYANDVETARKELELAKKNQQKAIDQQRRAQRIQIALDTASQAANLITASSLIWKQLGFPWAIPALAVMWGSFAAAKVQALSAVNAGTEKYGEGTVELLEGGSHQSGNDIDLGRKSNGTRRRAEGGEFLAVINKRNSRKYRDIIPDVINSLNQGTFAEKYLNAYDGGGVSVVAPQGTNLSRVEAGIDRINDNLEKPTTFVDKNGNMVTIYKNVKRVIKS
jgi:TP901 family phage tail tape measure protein